MNRLHFTFMGFRWLCLGYFCSPEPGFSLLTADKQSICAST